MINFEKIKDLLKTEDDGLILSYLQGYTGKAFVDNENNPTSAQIVVGDFSFFVGDVNIELIKDAKAPILTPQDKEWQKAIEDTLRDKVSKKYRYKIKKDINSFDSYKLSEFVNSLDKKYELKQIDQTLYESVLKESWSEDLCSQFKDYDAFKEKGLGFVILKDSEIVSGASSYVVYDDGLEIEIDTKLDYRGKNLATVCGAKLILECLDKNIYPSWDAIDLRSVALAEKLGYQLDTPYVVYYYDLD